jgi:hypothetical protein
VFSGEAISPEGRVPKELPGARKSIHRCTVREAVSTAATRQSGYPSRPGKDTYSWRPSGVRATEVGQLRKGWLTNGQCRLPPLAAGAFGSIL